jgi:hypothetical protein
MIDNDNAAEVEQRLIPGIWSINKRSENKSVAPWRANDRAIQKVTKQVVAFEGTNYPLAQASFGAF